MSLIQKIIDLGCIYDAIDCAMSLDLCGLAYIANMAEGKLGSDSRKVGELFNLVDELKKI